MPLLEARKQYKPFEYPWAFEYWKRQQQIHWMPEEVPLGEDCRDWAQKLTEHRAQPADPDLPLLHPGRRRGAGLLPRQIRPRVQADRDQDDADRVLQHGDGPHRRLLAPARHDRHARERIQRLPPVQGDEGQARLPAAVRRRHRRGHRQDARHVRRLHRGAAAVRQLRDADELPALQQDEGHGPDHQLVGPRREPPLRRHHQAVPRLREGTRLPDPGGQGRDHRRLPEDGRGSRMRSSTSRSKWARSTAWMPRASRSTSATSPTGAWASSASRRSTWSTSTRSPGSPRCSTASSTPTSSKPARPNIRRPRRGATGTASGTTSTGGRRRRREAAANDGGAAGEGGEGPDMFAAAGVAAE